MAIEVSDKQKKLLDSVREHLKGTEYFLNKFYPKAKFYSICKKRKGFFKKHFPEEITYNLFIYDDLIYISISESRKEELQSLFEGFDGRIKLEIADR